MTGRWTWRRAGPADREDQRRLFNLCFRKQKQRSTFEWKYERNPHGPAASFVAVDEDDGHVVGAYSYVPRRFLCDGRPALLMQASDATVDPAWQRKGIFRGLDDVAAAAAAEQGVPWAFAYSGRLSLRGFLANGWQVIGHAEVLRYRFRSRRGLLRLGRVGPLAARAAPLLDRAWRRRDVRRFGEAGGAGEPLEPLERFPRSAEELTTAAAPAGGWVGQRDVEWLNWRYIDTPTGRSEVFALRDGEDLRGWLVAEFVDGNAYLVDHQGRDPEALGALLRGFTAMAHARGMAEATALLCAHHPSRAQLLSLGWRAPMKDREFRDIFPFILRACADDARPEDAVMPRWHLADGDRDAEHMSP